MKQWLFGFTAAATALAGLALWKGDALLLGFLDWRTPKTGFAEHQAFIRDYVTIVTPDNGAAPYPTVIQFHGCAGMREAFHENWAARANAAGYAVMLVDSNTARGIGYEESLKTVCEGKTLLGQERAGDVLAAIAIAQEDARLDTERLVLAGWSHGAWTVMDFLTMDMNGRRPANLTQEELIAPEIDGAVLFYPHCGRGALSQFRAWRQTPQTLAFIAGRDTIVDPEPCVTFFSAKKNAGDPVDLVIYPEADHIFDDATLRDEHPEYYDENAARDAARRYSAYLAAILETER